MTTTSQRVLGALAAIRLGKVHVREIRKETGLTEDQVQDALQTLVRSGLARRLGDGWVKATPDGLKLLEAGKTIKSGPKGPRPMADDGTSLRSRLWRALRLVRKGSIPDLLELAARGEEGNAYDNAKIYLNALTRAGILMRLTRKGEPAPGAIQAPSRYNLVRDTGPVPPQFNKRQKRVFDPNTKEVFDVG